MKTVNFLGQDWEVPDWAKYITQDTDCSVWCWEHEPIVEYDEWMPQNLSDKRENLTPSAEMSIKTL